MTKTKMGHIEIVDDSDVWSIYGGSKNVLIDFINEGTMPIIMINSTTTIPVDTIEFSDMRDNSLVAISRFKQLMRSSKTISLEQQNRFKTLLKIKDAKLKEGSLG